MIMLSGCIAASCGWRGKRSLTGALENQLSLARADAAITESKFGFLISDCLEYIFSFLPILDKFNCELVSKHWRYSSRQSWRSMKELEIDMVKWQDEDFEEDDEIQDKRNKRKMRMFKAIMNRSGRYLTAIDFTHLKRSYTPPEKKYDIFTLNRYATAMNIYVHNTVGTTNFEGIKALAENCTNLKELCLSSFVINCNDEHLSKLFANNSKIRYLSLMWYGISGDCFSSLSAENIEILFIQRCYNFDLPENMYKLLSRCTKLKNLSLWGSRIHGHPDRNIMKLINSNIIQNLRELYLEDTDEISVIHYLRFHVRLDQLTTIQLNNVYRDSYVINQILIEIGANCKNLTRADFSECSTVEDYAFVHITKLPKLETLCIDCLNRITSMPFFYLSENLKALRCYECINVTDTGIISVLNRSKNIEYLEVSYCTYISNETVNHAIQLTKSRNSDVVLNMYVEGTNVKEWEIEEFSPFLQLHNVPTQEEENYYNNFREIFD